MSVRVGLQSCKLALFIALIFLCFYSDARSNDVISVKPQWQIQLLKDVEELASDKMQGRKAPSTGHRLAQEYIKLRFQQSQLSAFQQYPNFEQKFAYGNKPTQGKNLLGYVKGTKYPELYFVITAHYDHLGQSGNRIYRGANDNASGVAAMFALLSYLTEHKPAFSFIFVATDAEEVGLKGAMHFVENSPVNHEHMLLNINLDMIGDGGRKNLLYLLPSSSKATVKQVLPKLSNFTQSTALTLKWRKHSRFQRHSLSNDINWREASDHAAFRKIKVPYLYFGADTNRVYHTTKDKVAALNQDFFVASASAIIKIVDYLQNLTPNELRKNGK